MRDNLARQSLVLLSASLKWWITTANNSIWIVSMSVKQQYIVEFEESVVALCLAHWSLVLIEVPRSIPTQGEENFGIQRAFLDVICKDDTKPVCCPLDWDVNWRPLMQESHTMRRLKNPSFGNLNSYSCNPGVYNVHLPRMSERHMAVCKERKKNVSEFSIRTP